MVNRVTQFATDMTAISPISAACAERHALAGRTRSRIPWPTRSSVIRLAVLGMIAVAAGGCARQVTPPVGADATEAYSMLGRRLERPQMEPEQLAKLKEDLANASKALARAPNDPDSLIWVGRRLAYLGRYRDALDTFTVGAQRFSRDARFLRHRGHRYLTVRRPSRAAEDLAKAAQLIAGTTDVIEPDGAPNARDIPLSTLHFNIWYHLGLAHYLNGDYDRALAAYDSCMKVSVNPDLQVATSYWRYLTLRRLKRDAEAESMLAIARANPELIENGSYLKLLRLFAGLEQIDAIQPRDQARATVADATTAYGVSMWHLLNGREKEARHEWRRIAESPAWASFGVVAAESELSRLR
jgi:tetratricopeptide (TPR) repeat protein